MGGAPYKSVKEGGWALFRKSAYVIFTVTRCPLIRQTTTYGTTEPPVASKSRPDSITTLGTAPSHREHGEACNVCTTLDMSVYAKLPCNIENQELQKGTIK